MANTHIPVIGPVVKVLTNTDPTALAAAVATQVNTLQQQYVNTPWANPLVDVTSGNVEYGSIVCDPVSTTINTQGAITYIISVRWKAFLIPT
jgi:hypothetical protein